VDDETQQAASRSRQTKRPRAWRRWIGGVSRHAEPAHDSAAAQLNVHKTLKVLPTLLESSSLPNGVVELVIEDIQAPTRQLFDIHDGHITLVEPGKCVPWACISGSSIAWAAALGPARDTAALQLTGDEELARRVLDALPHQS
jgi:hypothetical protein